MTKMYLAVAQTHGERCIYAAGTAKNSQDLADWDAIRYIFNQLVQHFDKNADGNLVNAPAWLMKLAILLSRQEGLFEAWAIVNGPNDTAKRAENANLYERLLDFRVEIISFEVIA